MSSDRIQNFSTATAVLGDKRNYPLVALTVGVLCLFVSLVGIYIAWESGDSRPLLGWLMGFTYWFMVSIGMLFLIMIFYVFDSGWSVVVRRQMEHGVGSIKWLGLIFLPLILFSWLYKENPGILWSWMNPNNLLPGGHTIGEDSIFRAKSSYLNLPAFTLRSVLYFVVFIALAEVLRFCSFSLEKDGDPKWMHIAHNTSAIGIILCSLAATFAAVDWYKALEYHWFSTIYGVWFFAESMRAGVAVLLLVCVFQASKGNLKGIFNRCHSHNLGCLMLTFTIFWAYISFSQYFLVYNANIPEETFWYNIRELNPDGTKSSWWWVSMTLVFLHFLFPFIYLLWYKNKFGRRVIFISFWILFFHSLDIYWNILPEKLSIDTETLGYVVRPFGVSIWDVSTFVGVGGICIWAFLTSAAKVNPIPIRDPRIEESINAHE